MLWSKRIDPEKGPYNVALKRGTLCDEARKNEDGTPRTIEFKLYHPSVLGGDVDAVPLIVWSHGYGGSRDGAGFLARYLTSHGYAVLHLTHHGTDSSLWEGKTAHPWDVLKDMQISRDTTLNRYTDLNFALDALPAWMAEKASLDTGGTMDRCIVWDKIGMSGHSFGAITAQVAAGQLTPDHEGELISLHEPRVTAAIAYSPVPGTSHLSDDTSELKNKRDIYADISTPMLHMTGTEDSSPTNGLPYKGRLKVFDRTYKAEKALLIKAGGDHMVYNGTRGGLKGNPLRVRHEAMIRHISLAWWDAWLRDDRAAMTWLRSGGVRAYLATDAEWTYVA